MTDKPTKPEEIVQLKALCAYLKIDPREARQKLRLAVKDAKKYPELAKVYEARKPWQWVKDTPAHKEAQTALAS